MVIVSTKTFLAVVYASLVIGDLKVDEVSDGSCLPVRKLLPHLYPNASLSFLPAAVYYVPMGSRALYRHYAQGLLGRPVANESELDSMKLLIDCAPSCSTVTNIGFPHYEIPPTFGQVCVPSAVPNLPELVSGNVRLGVLSATCAGLTGSRPNGTTQAPPSNAFIYTVDSLLWANSDETALLVYRCPADRIKDWKVIAKTKTLRKDDIEIIKERVLRMGFNHENFRFMEYDS